MTDPSGILEKCRQLDLNGDFDASIRLLTDSIARTPSAPLYFERGWRLEQAGRLDEAKIDYDRAIHLGECVKYLIARGLLLSDRLSDPKSALRDFQQGLRFDGYNHNIYINICSCSLLLGRLGEAIDAASVAVQLAPKDHTAHSCLGQSLLAANRPGEAAAELQIATSLDPASADSWSMLARSWRKMGDLAKAKICYEEAIKNDKSKNYLISYASFLLDIKDAELAVIILQEVRAMHLTVSEVYLVEGYLEVGSRLLAESEKGSEPEKGSGAEFDGTRPRA